MKVLDGAAALCFLLKVVAGADPPRPRGVGPEFVKFYQSSKDFTCVSNPSIQLPVSAVNDDYCDCPDGSDEPGTAACSYISPLSPQISDHREAANTTLALPGFYCKNKGHNPAYVPFNRVNDGVCDYDTCCDGSDEWASVGGVKCPDKCKEIGSEWRKLDEKRKLSVVAALRKRAELVEEAKKARKEIEDWLKNVAGELQALEAKAEAMEKEKNDIEVREQSRIVKQNNGGKAGVLSELAKGRLSVVREGLNAVRGQRNTYKSRVAELEEMLNRFKEDQNDATDEKLVAVRTSYETYIAREPSSLENDAQERDWEDVISGDDGISWEDFERDDGPDDIEVLYKFEEYLPQSLKEWLDAKLRTLRLFLVHQGILAAQDKSQDGESQAMRDARDRSTAAQNDLNDKRNERDTKQEDLLKDYGPDDIFRPRNGRCDSLDSGEYTYELCWMDRVTQKPKKGGMQHGMGNYARFESVIVDEDVDAQGKGLGKGKRLVMKFENGSHCWNGPPRSTVVVMACAEGEEIWRVVEEAKCEYRLEVGTPAVCQAAQPAGDDAKAGKKDEL